MMESLEYYFAPIDQIGNISSCAAAEQLMSFLFWCEIKRLSTVRSSKS